MRAFLRAYVVTGLLATAGMAVWFSQAPAVRAEGGSGPSGAPAGGQGAISTTCTGGSRVGPPPPDTMGTCAKCYTPTPPDPTVEYLIYDDVASDLPGSSGMVWGHDLSVRGRIRFPPLPGDCVLPLPEGGGGGGVDDPGKPDLSPEYPGKSFLVYDSKIALNRETGNWWAPWDIYVVSQANGDLKYYEPGRPGDTYVWNAVTQKFVSPPGYFDQMVSNPNGTWTRTTKHGMVWQFNAPGYLVSVADRYGLTTTINRNAQNQVTTIVDYAGRTLTMNYYSNGYLSSVVDWAGNTTTLTYTLQGYLSSITYPPTTYYDRASASIVTRGKTVTFQYMTNTGNTSLDGNLTGQVDDAGNGTLTATYDSQDRVITLSTYGRTWTFQPNGGGTLVTGPDGITVQYGFNARGAITRKEVFTRAGLGQPPLRQGEPNSYVWTYAYTDPCGCDLPTQITRPDGASVSMVYDSLGNMTSRVSTPPTGSSDPVRTDTWTYSTFAQFSQLLTHTQPSGNVQGAVPADHTRTYSRDAMGNATSVTYPKATVSGVSTTPTRTFTYNSIGRPLTKTDFNGAVTKYEYAPVTQELIKETRDFGTGKLNLLAQFSYDTLSRLTSVTDPRGNVSTIQYNAVSLITETQGPSSLAGRVRRTYDNFDLLYMLEIENKDANGNQVGSNPWFTKIYNRNSNNLVASEVVEVDATTTATTQQTFTAGGRPWRTTDPVGNVIQRTYDERGLPFTVTEGFGSSVAGTTTLNYDLNGRPASMVNPRGYVQAFTHNHEGGVASLADPSATSTIHGYDINGNLTQVEVRNAQGVALARQAFQYDPFGLQTASSRYLLDSQGGVLQTFTTTFTYGAALLQSQSTDPLNNVSTRTYDAVGRLTQVQDAASNKESLAYDGNGNVTSVTTHSWNQVTSAYEPLVEESQYDALNRRTQSTRRDQGTTLSATRSWTYDSRGNVLDECDEVGNTRHYEYDARGLMTKTTIDLRAGGIGSGQIASTVVLPTLYDLAGRITARKDGLNQQISYSYDARSRVTSEANAANGTRAFTYDTNGNVATVTDPMGTVVTNTYDSRDLLTARSVARISGVIGTTAETYTFDALGRVLTVVDDDSTVHLVHDSLGRVATETEGPNPLSGQGKTFAYAHNGVGSITSLTYPDGAVESRGRDAIQRLTSVSIQGGPTAASYQYSGSRVIRLTHPNGVTRSNTFDALWRETLVDYVIGAGSARKFEYVFNSADQRLLEKRHHAGGTGDNYSLDSLYRTVLVKEGVADPILEHQTPGSQTVAATKAPVYDGAQNRTQVTVTVGGTPVTTTYAADALNFYASIGGATHVRDANGNLRDDGTRLYEYDYRDQLCRVTNKATGALIATFKYDAVGRRIEKTTPAQSWSFYWAFSVPAIVYDSAGLYSRRHFGSVVDEVVGAWQRDLADVNGNSNTSELIWFTPVYDGAADCVAMFGPGGTVVESYVHSYDGVVAITNGAGQAIATSAIGWWQGYAGMQRDEETGLLYARLRYYNPGQGRFLNEDPLGMWHDGYSLGNGYSLLGDSYRNGLDPFGLKKVCCGKKYAIIIYDPNPFGRRKMKKILGKNPFKAYSDTAKYYSAISKVAAAFKAAGMDVRYMTSDTADNIQAVLPVAGTDPCFEGFAFFGHGKFGRLKLSGSKFMESNEIDPGQFGKLLDHSLEGCFIGSCSGGDNGTGTTWNAATGTDGNDYYGGQGNESASDVDDGAGGFKPGGGPGR